MSTKDEVLRALVQEWGLTEPKENEMTVKELVDIMNMSDHTTDTSNIYNNLAKMVDQGILQNRWAKNPHGGSRLKAYSPAEGKTWEDVLQYIRGK